MLFVGVNASKSIPYRMPGFLLISLSMISASGELYLTIFWRWKRLSGSIRTKLIARPSGVVRTISPSIRIEGEIVRTTPEGLAINFVRIDPESLFHLQNIVKYNSPDADIIESEINKNPGIR